jgi:hypothetical protein
MIIFLVTPAVRIARPYYRRHKEALDAAMIEPTAPAQITVLTPSITIRLLLDASRIASQCESPWCGLAIVGSSLRQEASNYHRAAALRNWLGVLPVQRLNAWVNALTS